MTQIQQKLIVSLLNKIIKDINNDNYNLDDDKANDILKLIDKINSYKIKK